MRDLLILGTAGNSLEMLDLVLALNRARRQPAWRVLGFLDDDQRRRGREINGVPVLGGLDAVRAHPGAYVVNGIGSVTTTRLKPGIVARLGLDDTRFATLVHPSAVVSDFAHVGAGSVLLAGVVVGTGARIGRHVTALPTSVISHDAVVDDFATLASAVSLSGSVRIGRAAYVGTRVAIREGVSVGAEAVVGMGAVVLRDVAPSSVVAGVPAVELKRRIGRS